MLFGTLAPADGRDYKSGKAAVAAWNAGTVFFICNPNERVQCSIRNAQDCPVGHTLQIRWKRLTHVGLIRKRKDGTWTFARGA